MTFIVPDKRTKMLTCVINPSGPWLSEVRDPESHGRETDAVASVAGINQPQVESPLDSADRWMWPHRCAHCDVVIDLDIRSPPQKCPECGAHSNGSGTHDPWVGVIDVRELRDT